MKVLRVFNNNVLLAADAAGDDVILTGRGLGYQARPGQEIDPAKVARVFVPADGRDPDHLAGLMAGIAPEYLALVATGLEEIGLGAKASAAPTLIIALADHLSFAARRLALGMTVDYPLLCEVRDLYPDEYAQGVALVAAVNEHLEEPLPAGEAVAVALHLVNAGFATGDLAYTYTMTGVIHQMVDVIGQSYGLDLGVESVSVGRLITHLRYLFVRIHQHRQVTPGHSSIGEVIRASYPQALACAQRLAGLLELRLGAALTDDEVSYLTLHIARVAEDQGLASGSSAEPGGE